MTHFKAVTDDMQKRTRNMSTLYHTTVCRRELENAELDDRHQFPPIELETGPAGPDGPRSGLYYTLRGTLREYISYEISDRK